MIMFRRLDIQGGSPVRVDITAYGTRTDDPCIVLKVDATEVITTDPERFFAQVDQARRLWENRITP